MKLASALGALAVAAALTTGVQAADPVMMTPAPVMSYASPTFNWDGFYAGLGVTGAQYSNSATVGTINLVLGANATSGNFLVGAEGTIGYGRDNNSNDWFVLTGEGRVGYLVSPQALIYVAGGVENYTPNPGPGTLGTVGGGVEFAVSSNVSLDVEYKYLWNNSWTANQIGASALWHF